jgi:hypothetical protein
VLLGSVLGEGMYNVVLEHCFELETVEIFHARGDISKATSFQAYRNEILYNPPALSQ